MRPDFRRRAQMDESDIHRVHLLEEYLAACRTSGKTTRTLRGWHEKLSRFVG